MAHPEFNLSTHEPRTPAPGVVSDHAGECRCFTDFTEISRPKYNGSANHFPSRASVWAINSRIRGRILKFGMYHV